MSGSPASVPADADARGLIASALDDTLVVEAAAGTGKTTELVRRILSVLATGRARVTSIVAVTFTEKAAGELRLRLRQDIEGARRDAARTSAEKTRLDDALAHLEEAHIGTIHGFCADLLRERPVEAAVDPLFSVFTDAQARRTYADAFGAWLQHALEDPPPGVRRALARSSRPRTGGEPDEDGPVDRLRRAGWDLVEWRDFDASWIRPAFDRPAEIASLSARLHAFVELRGKASSTRDILVHDTAPAARASEDVRLALEANDLDAAEALLADLRRDRDFRRPRKGSGASFGEGIPRADVLVAHQDLVDALDRFGLDADADLAALLRDELRGSLDRYVDLKTRAGALDFLDLLVRARDLVRGRREVREAFQVRFSHIFVDEFQDTDPLQAELLLLLAADDPAVDDWTRVRPVSGKLFIVGDPKQSIYRFRRADVGVYRAVCDQLVRAGARAVRLTTSFRSVPGLQHAVNAAFTPLMTGDLETLQADYVPLSPNRPAVDGQPTLLALPVPRPYGKQRISAMAIEASLPDAVGAFVDWLLRESGWTVTERRSGSERVPVQARHVCILFRRFVSFDTDVTRAYVDALEARGIRHLLVGGRSFHDREEVETLRAALGAIEWPDDELSVFATLRGGLFAIPDEALLEYRFLPGVRGFQPFRRPADLPDHLAPIGEALALLEQLHYLRNRRPVAETVTRLLDATRAHVGFALRRAGEQVLANVLHVAELARQYEAGGGISFRGFVDELRDAVGDTAAAEAPIVEEGSDGVRLMTVHKAKGLEFPVVILADITAKLAAAGAARHIDPARNLCALRLGGWSPLELLHQQAREEAREREEGIRVAYVAATRARDLLVVPAVGDDPYDGWAAPLNAALYPVEGRRAAAVAPGCPTFRKDSVLVRPGDETASPRTVSPGLHRAGAGSDTPFDVVWWDPAALALDADPPFGLRRQELISKDVAPEDVAAGQRRYRDWRQARDAALASGRTPALTVRTATDWASTPAVEGLRPVAVETVVVEAAPGPAAGGPHGAPAGPRYGTLVHAVLATVPLDAGDDLVARVVETQTRIVAATPEEAAGAATAVRAVLAHPVVAEARRSPTCLRETPITITSEGVLIEGVVDLAFEAADGSTVVVDFKTDRARGSELDTYRRQVGLYAEAIARATSRPARAVLMQI